MISKDGEAVTLARAAIRDATTGASSWRSTVVFDREAWIVRTWTQTPPSSSRPDGHPQYVHRVTETDSGLVVNQIFPRLEHFGAEG